MYGMASLFFFTVFKAFITPDLATEYLAGAVLLVVIPLVGGVPTRMLVTRQKGQDYFDNVFVKKFDGITTLGLLLTEVPVMLFLVRIANRTKEKFL